MDEEQKGSGRKQSRPTLHKSPAYDGNWEKPRKTSVKIAVCGMGNKTLDFTKTKQEC